MTLRVLWIGRSLKLKDGPLCSKNKEYAWVLLNLVFLSREKINLKAILALQKTIVMSNEHVTQVNLIENGPVVVVGSVDLHHPDGRVERRERRSSFCRCGKSASMPMCDGSHKN